MNAARSDIVYGKQPGGPRVPLTVRVDWLPDGSLRPRLYWLPDGTCCQVTHVYECMPLAFLKDRGEGLRFKVRAKVVETPDPYSELRLAQVEAYLFFEDGRFCEKNIVDARYGHAAKEYVPVSLDVFPDGGYELTHFWFHGTRYHVEKTLDVGPRGAYRAGGVGLRHEVEARRVGERGDDDPDPAYSVRRMAALYLEVNKWFVSVSAS